MGSLRSLIEQAFSPTVAGRAQRMTLLESFADRPAEAGGLLELLETQIKKVVALRDLIDETFNELSERAPFAAALRAVRVCLNSVVGSLDRWKAGKWKPLSLQPLKGNALRHEFLQDLGAELGQLVDALGILNFVATSPRCFGDACEAGRQDSQ
jgi:hypothetical protein